MGKNKPKISGNDWIVIILALIICVVSLFSAAKNPKSFWTFSISNALTLLVAIGVSYYLVQRKADIKNKKEAIIRLMTAIQKIVTDEDTYTIHVTGSTKSITMRKRQLSNYLDVLIQYDAELCDKDDLDFIEEKFEEYASLIGNHIDDLEHLANSTEDLKRPLDLIDSRLYAMALKLYS